MSIITKAFSGAILAGILASGVSAVVAPAANAEPAQCADWRNVTAASSDTNAEKAGIAAIKVYTERGGKDGAAGAQLGAAIMEFFNACDGTITGEIKKALDSMNTQEIQKSREESLKNNPVRPGI
ncbi:putative protein OS=Tsukamurella paurometabola (strain ATCC 8368 / DSM / CCUG 35730 /CIP 100753 / JCM 10117 / KCTC 9821 / NBRC 16120 / NCIMB 702349/ NCTC 13040) OX=521096 GN=Tpau_1102 PE=4 SV=1 [Tsukamurella paurometabola]|uniref:Uncharacterized protein n=1 Tax=Tsukamurella paurometabola (strain ATCC 8368 / DSM 20162 / CCUG 35730 / CIP 100753 / JCM 10117 / KCTC 9821 / NBRC 16120 / NCIMB 702349 / NCTC 13040) TaxID=521096 RepID=D5UVE4_TSUPD|nr:hypothetical protein [Tsukamurella paurometabola]ADG77734.1 hypothetical protein Tpau_1102 [Tsukamurella paurometabola DSM 20162]SUP28544.1 Uncharacterised protein [Tsukamurella paurometabola]